MDNIVGIRFREDGKIYHFAPGHFVLKQGDEVIVKTEKGLSFGVVATPIRKREPNYPRDQLKEVFRLANEKDRLQYKANLDRRLEAHNFCQERIDARKLPMTLVDVESFFDGSKIIFYFYADGRVDFRELVKDLVKRQMDAGADICKVVTVARSFEDNLTVLRLIKEFPEKRVVSLTMGDLGTPSRILCPLLGGDFTYASLARGKESAPGQMTVSELRKIYALLNG